MRRDETDPKGERDIIVKEQGKIIEEVKDRETKKN